MGIAMDAYQHNILLSREFPTLDIMIVRSSSTYRNFIVGFRPKHQVDGVYAWFMAPVDGFPQDEVKLKLMLVA